MGRDGKKWDMGSGHPKARWNQRGTCGPLSDVRQKRPRWSLFPDGCHQAVLAMMWQSSPNRAFNDLEGFVGGRWRGWMRPPPVEHFVAKMGPPCSGRSPRSSGGTRQKIRSTSWVLSAVTSSPANTLSSSTYPSDWRLSTEVGTGASSESQEIQKKTE